MREDIQEIVNSGNACRRYNVVKSGFHPSRSVTAFLPGDHYQVDLAQFPKSTEGYNYCMVLIDVFTGFIMFSALKTKEMSEVTQALWEIFTTIGMPKILQSDNGTEFKNQAVQALCRQHGIQLRYISQYNPRADGKVERAVQSVKQTILKRLHGASIFWPYHLPFVQFTYNDKVQALTGSTPFSLMYGRDPNTARDYSMDPLSDDPEVYGRWQKHQEEMISLIYPAVGARASAAQKKYRDHLDRVRRRLVNQTLAPGTIVMIKDPKYLLNPGSKPVMEPKNVGPYTILRVTKYGAYVLADEHGEVIDRNVPLDQMKVVAVPGKAQPRPLEDDEKTYVVEAIRDHRVVDGAVEYLVKWTGYEEQDCTWTKEEDFVDTKVIDDYLRSKVPKRRRARAAALGALPACVSMLSFLDPAVQGN